MTGYTVHTGTSDKYAAGWDSIFGGKPAAKKPAKGKKPVARKKPTSGKRKK